MDVLRKPYHDIPWFVAPRLRGHEISWCFEGLLAAVARN